VIVTPGRRPLLPGTEGIVGPAAPPPGARPRPRPADPPGGQGRSDPPLADRSAARCGLAWLLCCRRVLRVICVPKPAVRGARPAPARRQPDPPQQPSTWRLSPGSCRRDPPAARRRRPAAL